MASKKDYLHLIHELEVESNELGKSGVKSIHIANNLKISKASVSEMLRKLEKEKLIKFSPYSKIYLTTKGRKQAKQIHHKHKTLTKFIQKLTDFELKKARQEAHKLKHSLSDETLKKILELMELENPQNKIKPIPSYVN